MASTKRDILILGLGHIGASLAWALSKSHKNNRVWGWDQNPAAVQECERRGWIKKTDIALDHHPLCVVAVPEDVVGEQVLKKILAQLPRGTLVTDVFSSKGEGTKKLAAICRKLGLRFAWSHPLAGREGHGVQSADSSIFAGATVLLDRKIHKADWAELNAFWTGLGCRLEQMTTSEHQKAMAAGSHLMHVVAFSLAKAVGKRVRISPSVLSMTRVALSNPTSWTVILNSNREALLPEIKLLQKELAQIVVELKAKKTRALRARLSSGHAERKRMERAK